MLGFKSGHSVSEPAHLRLRPLPLETLVPQAAGLWVKQVSEAGKLMSTNSQLRGCPAGKIHREQCCVKVKPSGKTGQLFCLVSSFLSKTASNGCLHKWWQKLAA